MPLHALSEEELRGYAKRAIEAAERWLRRLVHETFCAEFGLDYINATDTSGKVFNSKTRRAIENRLQREPERYERPIDATTLE